MFQHHGGKHYLKLNYLTVIILFFLPRLYEVHKKKKAFLFPRKPIFNQNNFFSFIEDKILIFLTPSREIKMTKFFFLCLFVAICLNAISATINNVALPKPRHEKQYNKFVQTMLSQLVTLRYKAEHYMKANDLPFTPSQEYP